MLKTWFMAMLAVLFLAVPCAWAAPETPYDASTLVLYHEQTEDVQAVIDLLYDAAADFRIHVELPAGTRYDDVGAALMVLAGDFPELFYLENLHNVGYFTNAPDVATYVDLAYRMDAAAARAQYGRLMQTAQSMVDSVAHLSAYDRALALHDALCERSVYLEKKDDPYIHEATGALLNGVAVCEGYAQAYALLLRLSGIPSSMVSGISYVNGQAVAHGWNVVVLAGRLVQTDVTWDDQPYGAMHWYFNLSDAQMATDHVLQQTDLPLSKRISLEYHFMKGGYVAGDFQTRQRIVHAKLEQYARTGKPVELRMADAQTFALLVSELGDHFTTYNRQAGDWKIDHELNIYGLESQLCLTLLP